MRAFERFLNYAVIHTRSDETSASTPSTDRQFTLANRLAEELRALGVPDAAVDERCYVYASLPATPGLEEVPAVGFIAHMDTAHYEAGHVRPRLHPDYDGGAVQLEGRVLSPEMFPHLPGLKGQTLITAAGDTLLGADDKAGIAEIMTMVERLQAEGLPHGRVCVGFTPDEEIGRGADHFDIARFGAETAYTVDGGAAGEISFENFNAAGAEVTVHGVDVHPGSSKDVMVNALLVGMAFHALLPAGETPRDTEGYEGFYHLMQMEGGATQARLRYIVRDHDAASFQKRLDTLRCAAETLNRQWGAGTVELEITEQYRNMAEIIRTRPELIERARRAARKAGLTPRVNPIRGGTDGAQLSFRGLPCPDLGTGGYAYHGPFEHITAEAMDRVAEMLVILVTEEFV
ncbi:MAG: peptidase T [Oscillospiraceae bacterium]|nr:peptidase T [Oscillospiraceae bacterium]